MCIYFRALLDNFLLNISSKTRPTQSNKKKFILTLVAVVLRMRVNYKGHQSKARSTVKQHPPERRAKSAHNRGVRFGLKIGQMGQTWDQISIHFSSSVTKNILSLI